MKPLLTGFLVFYVTLFYGQELKQLTTDYYNSNNTKRIYHVLKKKKRIKHGEYIVLNKNSTKNLSGWYNMNKRDSLWKFYSPQGVVMIEGYYKNDNKNGEWKYYRENEVIESIGIFKNDQENGHWLFYNETGKLICEGDFKEGKEVENSFRYYDINGNIIDSLEVVSDPIVKPICRTTDDLHEASYNFDKVAYFRLGDLALYHYFGLNMRLPFNTRDYVSTGSAKVIFMVKPNGKIEIIKIIGSFSEIYDKEIEKLLLSMPKWIPSTKDGNPVKAICIQSYSYKHGWNN